MFDGLNYITLYWLSGFAEPKYEIWEAKKATIRRAPDSLSFSLYLAWPLEVADEGRVIIRLCETGLTLETDWFPEEEFELHSFFSPDQAEVILKGSFERENIFIHFHK
ncbi:MAG: hypothetical protein ACOZFS_02275 [Thermodesulfobacteriota bacterium]